MDLPKTKILGDWGEERAARYLERQGLRVVGRHFRQKWGEIDLICLDRGTYVFIEVKTRSAYFQPSAVDSITSRKRLRIIRAAMSYVKWKRLENVPVRFDLVLIEAGNVEWIKDAFVPPDYYTY